MGVLLCLENHMDINLIKDMAEAVKSTVSQDDRTSPYDTSATVRRIEGGTAWVHIPGGVDETPVRLTIACKPGDTVQVRVGGGSAWLVGNATAPPTDDTRANEVYDLLKKTRKDVQEFETAIENGEFDGAGVGRVVIQYCLANARSIPAGGTFEDIQFTPWSETIPAYQTGKFYWYRTVTYLDDGTVIYGEPRFYLGGQASAEALIAAQNAADAADEAERIASAAESLANTKRRVFNAQPVPPYDLNDMWFDGAHGTTYLCTTAKDADGTFAASDWEEYVADVSENFWVDPNGAHVAENSGDLTTGASQTFASSGTVMRQNGKVISSWTGTNAGNAAINFYDLSSATERVADLMASYGRAGITMYINNIVAQALTPSGLSFYTPDSAHNLEAVFGSSGVELYTLGELAMALTTDNAEFYASDGTTLLAKFGATGAQVGYSGGAHTNIDANGMRVYGDDGTTQLAHIGYGTTQKEDGTNATKPYYTFGDRASGTIGDHSVVEGQNNAASGAYSHAEGANNTVSGHYAHVEGGGLYSNTAAGFASHVEGSQNVASANASYAHVGGIGNTAGYEAQTIIGKYAPAGTSDDLFVVGNGTMSHPSTAMRLKTNGRVEFAGAVGSGLTWASRSEMCNTVSGLSLYTPYNFFASKTDSGGTDIYWADTAGATAALAFGTICKMDATHWHMTFMAGGNVYKSIFVWDGSGTTTGTFATTLIG